MKKRVKDKRSNKKYYYWKRNKELKISRWLSKRHYLKTLNVLSKKIMNDPRFLMIRDIFYEALANSKIKNLTNKNPWEFRDFLDIPYLPNIPLYSDDFYMSDTYSVTRLCKKLLTHAIQYNVKQLTDMIINGNILDLFDGILYQQRKMIEGKFSNQYYVKYDLVGDFYEDTITFHMNIIYYD